MLGWISTLFVIMPVIAFIWIRNLSILELEASTFARRFSTSNACNCTMLRQYEVSDEEEGYQLTFFTAMMSISFVTARANRLDSGRKCGWIRVYTGPEMRT